MTKPNTPPPPNPPKRRAVEESLQPPRASAIHPPDPDLARPTDNDVDEGQERIENAPPPAGVDDHVAHRPPGKPRAVNE